MVFKGYHIHSDTLLKKKKKKDFLLGGVEPPSRDSKSHMITATLQENSFLNNLKRYKKIIFIANNHESRILIMYIVKQKRNKFKKVQIRAFNYNNTIN